MSEEAGERRARRRAEETGLSEEQLRHREDEAFAEAKRGLQTIALAEAYLRQSQAVPSFAKANAERSKRASRKAAIAQKLKSNGKSEQEIADMADRSVKTVRRWLQRDVP